MFKEKLGIEKTLKAKSEDNADKMFRKTISENCKQTETMTASRTGEQLNQYCDGTA